MVDIIMPKMGDAMEEGTLIAWRVNHGDEVKVGDIVAEIETDKSSVEIEAEGAGILSTRVKAGDVVPVGGLIGTIGGAGDNLPESSSAVAGQNALDLAASRPPAQVTSAAPRIETSTWKPGKPSPPVAAPVRQADDHRIKASPLARSMAKQRGVDITHITGTGPNGRIIESDVMELTSPAETAVSGEQLLARTTGADRLVELSAVRKVVAKRMAQSKGDIPHFYLTIDADVEDLIDLRAKLNSYDPKLPKISFNDLIVKAAAGALAQVREVNSAYRDGKILVPGGIHIGIAVALDDGLIVPVIRDADKLPLRQLAKASTDLIEKARQKKLQPQEYSGGTFTISNLGSFDVENFTAIVDPAQGAILAVATALKRPVVLDDRVVIRHRLSLTLSADHRVMDGVHGARFMQDLKRRLQNPLSILE